jgi:branched-chain amino acid transport system substrate-binding protein
MKMLRLTAAAALAALCGAALGAAAPPAVAQDLKFTIPLPMTGPLAFTGSVGLKGWQDAIDYINKNGGIRGRRIVADIYDDEYKVDVSVAGFKKAVANGDVVFAAGDGTPFVRAISPENNDKYKVLMSNTGNASDLTDTVKYHYHFLVQSTYSDMFGLLLQYIKGKQGNGPAPKVALVYSATEFGRDPIPYARARAKELGIDIVLEDETKFTSVDVTADAIKLRNAAADYVIFHGYAGNVWPEIARLARDYGVKSQFMGTIYAADPDLVRGVGAAADGYLGVVPFNMVIRGNPGPVMKVIEGYYKAWPNHTYTGYANIGYLQSWATALVLREVIGRAIDKGEALNGDNLIGEVRALKDWDSGGIYGGPVTFENQRIPFGIIYRYGVKDGTVTLTPETGWMRLN